MNNIKMIYGIDSLYYFCESNENYDNLFLDILDQMEDIKGRFEKRDIEYENNDINITINNTPLNYLGKNEGFYWFKDINEFFKIAFKDKTKNRGLNDIRIQLQGIGIYTIGIKSLIEFINKDLLKDYTTGYNPITRADLNCFMQYDFSFLTKEMFSTRKRNYTTISEIGTATSIQTIYVGKKPFLLRLYNKKEELKKSKKKDLMYEYFLNNEFDIEDDIFNIEFEIHRTHLKQYNILTVDNLLCNASKLFKQSMDDIRLIDIESTSESVIKNNKYKANTHPLWEHIKESYNLKEFLQTALPLERIKRKVSLYDDNKFRLEYIALLRRGYINGLPIDAELLESLTNEAKESLTKTTTTKEIKKGYRDVEYFDKDNNKTNLRWLEDGSLFEPINVVSVNELGDYALLNYINELQRNNNHTQKDVDIYSIAHKEAYNRGLVSDILPKF